MCAVGPAPATTQKCTTTDANGKYLISGLGDGSYDVTVTPPAGYTQTYDLDGTGTPNTTTVSLSGDTVRTDVDFGYEPTGAATIGDLVYEDIGNDGLFDGSDAGIPNVTVWLYEDTNGDGVITAGTDALVATTASAADGSYSFTGLAEGYDYLVKVDTADADLQTYFDTKYDPDPVSYQLSTDEISSSENLSGSDLDNDFGFWRAEPAAIGDQLFIDADGDGTFDAGEAGLANVTVYLCAAGADPCDASNAIATTVSAPDGTYLFDNLGPGSYTVAVDTADADIPAGLLSSVTAYDVTVEAGDEFITADFPFVSLLTKAVDQDFAAAGETLTYTVYPRFPRSSQLSSYIVEDPIPAGTTYKDGSVGQGGEAIDFEDVGEPGYGVIDSVAWDLGSTAKGAPAYKGGSAMCPVTVSIEADKDTYLDSNDPNAHYGSESTISVDSDKVFNGLVHFTLPTLPTGYTLDKAELRLTVQGGAGTGRTVSIRNLLQGPWTESTSDNTCTDGGLNGAAWQGPNCSDDWLSAGGNFGSSDYGTEIGAISPLVTNTPYAVDITSTVGDWLTDPAYNYGLALLPSSTTEVKFYARTANTAAYRPTLVLSYRAPIADGCSGTVTLADAGDTYIDKNSPTNNYGTQNTLKLRPEVAKMKAGLLKFDVSGIPVGSVIDSAAMQVTVKTAKTGHTYGVRQLLTPFEANAATWNDADGAGAGDWATSGVFGASDYSGTAVGAINAGTTGMKQVDVTALVEAWRTTPASNYGVALIPTATANLNKDSEIYSREEGTAARRPQIVVNWRIDPPDPDRVTQLEVNSGLVVSGDTVKVTMTLENDATVDRTNTAPSALTVVPGTPAASAACGAPVPASLTVPAGETRTVEYVCTLTYAGNVNPTGSLTFTGSATSAGGIVWGTATSNSVLVSPPLTFQVTVDSPVTLDVIENTGHASYTSPDGDGSAPSNTVQTATSASIGDFVWADMDGDGAQDAGEYGLAGVTVYVDADGDGLWDAGEGEQWTATDASGAYRMFGFTAGSYTVRTDPATYPAGYTPTTDQSLSVTLATGEQYSAADFGLQPPGPGSIGDTVWLDANGDGVYDPDGADDTAGTADDESALAGITVNLYRDLDGNGVYDPASDVFVGSTVTDASGVYSFTGLPTTDADGAVKYVVTVDEAASTVTSPYPGGASGTLADATDPTYDLDNGTTNPDGSTAVTLTTAAPTATDADFGYNWSGSIGDFVFYDTDLDGLPDAGEPPIEDAIVLLYVDANGDGILDPMTDYQIGFAMTDANGAYLFDNLPPGDYLVDVYEDSITSDGVRDVVPTTDNVLAVSLGAGVNYPNADFGYYQGARVEGDVFWDVDNNGVFDDGATGLEPVTVYLCAAGADPCDASNAIETATTDEDGHFFFLVPEGDYTLSYKTADVLALDPTLGLVTTPTSYTFHAEPGEDWHPSFDFGVDNSGAIGDTVWNDADNDGVQDAGEVGMAGVTVNLYAADGTTFLAATVTDENGKYLFEGLPDATYVVKVDTSTVPAGFTNSYDEDGGHASPNNETTATVAGGTAHLTADFGYYSVTSFDVSGNVFDDLTNLGVKDGTDTGIAGVTVHLYDSAGNVVATTTTDSSGNYTFPGIPNGSYTVKVDTTTLPSAAYQETYESDSSINNAIPVTVAGADVAGVDFGFHEYTGSISGTVCDGDGDGACEAGESPMAGVPITVQYAGMDGILGTADDVELLANTDASGNYAFTGLAPGLYKVIETNPAGYTSLTDSDAGNPDVISLVLDFGPDGIADNADDNMVYTDQDFEDTRLASVSGTVFDDLDGDGQQDPGEPGLAGVTVTLDDGDPGTAPLTATTDALGNYEFTNLLPGAYTITETDPAGYTSTGDADGANDNTIAVTLASGESVTERDFGDERPGSIAGVVFEDLNNNGVQDAGEGPLAGVTVCASPDGGVTTYCDTTDATGAYLIPDVPPGDYVVSETDPAGYVSTTPNTIPVSVSSGEAVTGVNYGDEPPAAGTHTIAGTVCENGDGDGVCDAGEALLPGVTVALYDAGGNLVATTTTDASGDYLFVNVPDGSYEVREVDPAGYTSVNDADGGTDNTVAVTVSGADVAGQDFVDAPTPGALSGTVYEDLNLNGQYDAGEPGIAGVTVTLDDGDPGTAPLTATTDANGAYSFTNLAPGVYTVTETDPADTISTGDVDGANDNTIVATVSAGQTTTNQDFGDAELGSLSGTVWDDADADGIQDAGELPLAGVLVCLTPDGAGVPVCTITDATGGYEFTDLAPGGYTVVETDPAGYTSTTPSSVPVTVPSGGAEVVDFGDVQPDPALGSISGTACENADGDGVCDADEPPLAGVTIELRDATTGVLLRTTTTDANGDYSFPNLPDGSYRVVEVDPAGYTSVNDADGGADSTISPITIAGGSDAVNQDFVDAVVPGAIGSTVWLDENGDGVQDAGEAGIPNLTVTLTGTDSNGNPVSLTTVTDLNGGYVFSGLPPSGAAGYTVAVTPPAGLDPTYDENGIATANTTSVVLAAGDEHLSADFGYNWAPPAASDTPAATDTGAIGDRVWIDADGDGVQDPGEPGLGGVTVTIYTDPDGDGVYDTPFTGATDAAGNPLVGGATTTAADGSYVFDSLPAGSYVVKVTLPAGYTPTGDPDGVLDNATTAPILLAPGDVYVNADFGYQPAAGTSGSIGDTVWLDADRDNTVDAGEPGLAGVTVALIQDSNGNGVWDAGEPIIATDITDAGGAYSFTGLPVTDGAGTDDYLVWVNDTANVLGALAPTYDADGAAPATGVETGLGISAVTDLTITAVTDADFGYAPAGHDAGEGLIGDTIYLDRDGGSDYDAGEGLEGVIVRLYADTNGDGNYDTGEPMLAQTVTDENGAYAFGSLPAGNYVVMVDTATLPAGVTNTVDPDTSDSPLNEAGVTLAAGSLINLAQDFGYTADAPGAVSGTLWNDSDADGALEAAEAGRYAGVTVALLDSNGDVVATTTTAADGSYSFAGLPPGSYTVDVTDDGNVLDGAWHSLGTADTAGQSQADPKPVTVTAGATTVTDFGYYRNAAALGNFVWDDLDKDGIQDAGDPGIDGVLVILTITYPNSAVTTVTTVTGNDPATAGVTEKGWYSFGNLLLDENYRTSSGAATPSANQPAYTIAVETPDNYTPTLVKATGSTSMNDSDEHGGTYGLATKGQTDVKQGGAVLLAAMNAALGVDGGPGDESNPIAGYDFGFVQNPTAVELSSFDATLEIGTVTLEWVTVSETDNLGFNVYRADDQAGPWARLNAALLPAIEPGSRLGHTYTWSDTTVLPNTAYVYRLEALDLYGEARILATIEVTSRPANRIWLPLVARSQ